MAYLLRCSRCKEYVPMKEMKEGSDGLWRCSVKCKEEKDD